MNFLTRYPEFTAFLRRSDQQQEGDAVAPTGRDQPVDLDTARPPEEQIDEAYQRLRTELADELLRQIMDCSPAFFERLVVDLLVKMGYGGTRHDAGQAVGRSGDGLFQRGLTRSPGLHRLRRRASWRSRRRASSASTTAAACGKTSRCSSSAVNATR